jgi:hypothetical protein
MAKGERNAAARIRDLAGALASRQDKLIPVDHATIFQKLDPIYSFLSQQTHAKGLDVYNLQEGRDNVPRYLPKSYDIWYSNMLSAFDAICFLYRIFFSHRIAEYLMKSPSEQQRACELAKSLSEKMPEFGRLISESLRYL